MKCKDLFLGIDTSNYMTSMALVNLDGQIVKDLRKHLLVAQGQKGLRQSEAVFQHITNIPLLASELFQDQDSQRLASITASVRPRPVEGSYMPCFKVGQAFGSALASVLNIAFNEVSHQEGHIGAIQEQSAFRDKEEFLALHLSGGTTEVLWIGESIKLLGGTKDISYGQLIDRVGVKLGMAFPCGEKLDQIAYGLDKSSNLLKPVSFRNGWINLSGIDTQISRELDDILCIQAPEQEAVQRLLIRELFDRINESLVKLISFWSSDTGCRDILITGGVSSSKTIRKALKESFSHSPITLEFGQAELASDNAVGLGFLGRKISCQKTQ
ncbi:MAG: O-sialoglycoprotein endopeptidase [Anaerovoracaceae bacterium]|nr:O-sialoglycoprotein endopeptidase [Anaerovoracaceae bacterium]